MIRNISGFATALVLGISGLASSAPAEEVKALGIRLEHYDYPFEVSMFKFKDQQQDLEMAYMDVKPEKPNGETVLLLHGKNFCGAYWETTAKRLAADGYRVVMPDQIGFGKSSKPAHYHFTFQSLATNTLALLDKIGVKKTHVLGHSMGGMLASRFALMFPERTQSLILENPIGLEDWKTKVPYPGVDQWYKGELGKTSEGIQKYQLESYYDGKWKPEYQPWVDILVGMVKSDGYAAVAWNQALTYDMIFTQPVVYEFPLIKVPTLLIIGQRDTTALGKNTVPEEVAKTMGNYPELGKKTASAIPDSKLVEINDIGHLPHIESFERFIEPLLTFIDKK
ncbi:alpha/beta hydrolase [Oceaniferula spumae]|uniref:Alpha/beta hydrolase n=1 Tax=Oceaniferula spumae TaxID=2979115 RepID=A0AAT9FKK9_9BACT